jgi:hypothetical protein
MLERRLERERERNALKEKSRPGEIATNEEKQDPGEDETNSRYISYQCQ